MSSSPENMLEILGRETLGTSFADLMALSTPASGRVALALNSSAIRRRFSSNVLMSGLAPGICRLGFSPIATALRIHCLDFFRLEPSDFCDKVISPRQCLRDIAVPPQNLQR